MDIKHHIETAVSHFGSQEKLAAAIGCSQQQISYLLKAKSISADMAKKIHEATGGKVGKHTLRPDIFDAPRRSGSRQQDASPTPTEGKAA